MVVGAARAAAAAPVTSMMQAQRRGCNDKTARSVATVNQLASAARHQMRSAAVHHYSGHTAVSAELRAYKQNKRGVGVHRSCWHNRHHAAHDQRVRVRARTKGALGPTPTRIQIEEVVQFDARIQMQSGVVAPQHTESHIAVLALNGRRLTALLFHPARRVLIRVLPLAVHTHTHGWNERWLLQNAS
jgi:hypothetical protein